MRPIIVVSIVSAAVIGVILIGLIAFLMYRRSPRSSLAQIRDSVKNRDVVTFEKHVDLDSVVSRGFDDAVAAMARQEDNQLGAGFAMMAKGMITEQIRSAVLASFDGRATRASSDMPSEEEVTRALESIELKSVEKRGKAGTASFSLEDPKNGEVVELQLGMRDMGGYWRVTHIANIAELVKPGLDKSRAISESEACQENLTKIDGALQQYILEEGLADCAEGHTALGGDWHALVGEDGYIRFEPVCPMGGEYTITPDCEVLCSSGLSGHTNQ